MLIILKSNDLTITVYISIWHYFVRQDQMAQGRDDTNLYRSDDGGHAQWVPAVYMVADLHFPRFFGTPIQCEIAWRVPRSVVKVGHNVQCKNISILSGFILEPRRI